MHEYDKSGKWLIQHHGDSILRLAGVNDIESWLPLQAEKRSCASAASGLMRVRPRTSMKTFWR